MQLYGIDEQLKKIETFIKHWEEYKKKGKSAILLYGPPGTGKTSSAYYIAKKLNMKLYEYNFGLYRTAEECKEIYLRAKCILPRNKLLLLDEFDSLAITPKKNEIKYPPRTLSIIIRTLKETNSPIIITCNNINYVPDSIKELCELVEYKRPDQKLIKSVAERMGIKYQGWIPSWRHLMKLKYGSHGYSVQSFTGRVKYFFYTGIVKDENEYDDKFTLCLVENVFKLVSNNIISPDELHVFLEILDVCDKIKSYKPLNEVFNFPRIIKNYINTNVRFLEKAKEVKHIEEEKIIRRKSK